MGKTHHHTAVNIYQALVSPSPSPNSYTPEEALKHFVTMIFSYVIAEDLAAETGEKLLRLGEEELLRLERRSC